MKSTVEILITACNNLGLEYRLDYSGRSMYGKQAFAIEDCGVGELMAELPNVFLEDFEWSDEAEIAGALSDFADELSELMVEVSDYCEDSLGLGTIHYWKNLEIPEELLECSEN